jgi:hypothetical protein
MGLLNGMGAPIELVKAEGGDPIRGMPIAEDGWPGEDIIFTGADPVIIGPRFPAADNEGWTAIPA